MVPVNRLAALIVTMTAVAWGGCSSSRPDAGWAEPRPLGADVPAYRPPPTPEDARERPQEPTEPSDELTLRSAVALALLYNSELAAFGWEVRSREARLVQAGHLPNPGLGVTVENLGTSRDDVTGGIQPTIYLSQLIELGGKRSDRMRAAERARDVAGWDYEIKRMDVLSRVSQAFVDVLSTQRRVALAEETVRLAEQSVTAVSERVKAGKVSPVEETKASVALSTVRIALERTKRELEGSRKALSATWGNVSPRFKTASGELDALPEIPPFEQVLRRLQQNPELALWAAEISLREAAVELEKSRGVPDVTIGAGYRRYIVRGQDVDAFLVGFSLPLPLFDRNQGNVQAARSLVARTREERRAVEVRLGLSLAGSYRALSIAHLEATSLRDTVLPGAQRAFEAVSEGYRLGRFGLLDVLDSQRTLSEARVQYLRSTTEYHKAMVDVERLIGERLSAAK